MEEVPHLISKKRKRSSSPRHPVTGTFTRSKSQIYLHYNRSGRLRSDSFRFDKHHVNLRLNHDGSKWKKAQIQSNKNKKKSLESTEVDDWSCTFIKDLRARRVFSLADNGCRLCVKGGEGDGDSEKGMNRVSFIVSERTAGKRFHGERLDENMESFSQEQNGTGSFENEVNSRSKGDNGGLSNEACDSYEERVLATPPDAEIVHMDNNVEYVSAKLLTENPEKNEIIPGTNMEKKIGNNSALKSAVNSWSRVSVFKAPGSLSYRRLLPYLMDRVHDNSSSPKEAKIQISENQQLSVDNMGTRNSNMEFQNDGSQSKDVPFSEDGLSNLTSASQSTLLSDDQSLSKLPADDAKEKIKMFVSCKYKKSEENFSLVENPMTIQCSDDIKPVDCGENKEDAFNSPGNDHVAKEDATNSPGNGQALDKPFNGSAQQNNGCSSDKRLYTKWGLHPCSQLNLFKKRSSFSYRRMLPYLMEITKDNSGDSRDGKCPKLEKNLHESLVSPSSVSDLHGNPADESMDRSSHMENVTDSCKMITLPSLNLVSSGNPIDNDNNFDTPVSVDSRDEQESHVMVNLSDNKNGQSDAGSGTGNLVAGSGSVTISVPPLVTQPVSGDFSDLVLKQVTAISEADRRTSTEQLINASKPVGGSFSQNISKLEIYDPSGVPANGLAKSILKRLPRGCRGPCTCLNCASFRLHAERAFEFSKNQMKDAEEISLALMKELSHLRNMLEKAASVSDDNLTICSNQVKEACRKSSEAEEVAKSRLGQMSYDLNIHCRISGGERPRVRFANNVEKRIFHG